MTGMPHNIEDLLSRLEETSRNEMDLVQALSEAVRKADDQLLKEVRSVTMLHEIRREAIFGELQHLAARLCALPVRGGFAEPMPALAGTEDVAEILSAPPVEHQEPLNGPHPERADPPPVSRAGDWRMAAQRIDEELEQYFGGPGPRH